MLLGLRTSDPVAECVLYDKTGTLVDAKQWDANRELAHGLLQVLDEFLHEHGCTREMLRGLFVYLGPGSFTGLRIGLTVMNTLAYAQQLPIVGETGEAWQETAVQRLLSGDNDRVVLPLYGADARITTPKK